MPINFKGYGFRVLTANATGSTVSGGSPLVAGDSVRIAVKDIANGAEGWADTMGVYQFNAASAETWS
ncbi:MAG TPA: DUF2190 family protein, partial [Phycisphaerae bacterium]|nr:DUF2190 family protein [Phycisphaerae bacterium]